MHNQNSDSLLIQNTCISSDSECTWIIDVNVPIGFQPWMEDLSHDKDKYQRANDKQTECDALMLLHI